MNEYNLYRRVPVWMQHILIGLKARSKERKRLNRSFCTQMYQQLLVSQYWSAEQIRAYQDTYVQLIVREAIEQVPYYQKLSKSLGLDAQDIKGVSDLQFLPVLEKSILRGNETEFVNPGIPSSRLIRGTTSGTTGTPLKLYYTRETFSKRWAFELRLRNWAGLKQVYHPRRAVFTGKDFIPQETKQAVYWRYARPLNSLMCSSYHISSQTARHYAQALARFAPEFIDGFPSALTALARICLHKGYPLPRVQAIRVSAEVLTEADRACLEQAFQAPVFNQYGSSESSIFCSDNPQGEMLIHPEFGHVEILPDGQILTTSFMNPVMPLIRYRIGDCVQLAGEGSSTALGRHFPRLQAVLGRADDVLNIRGKRIARLGGIWQDLDGLIESQIVLAGSDLLQLNLVVDERFKKPAYQRLIRERLHKKIGADIQVEFAYMDKIPRGENGKFKAIKNSIIG